MILPMKFQKHLLFFVMILVISCKDHSLLKNKIISINEGIEAHFAPDKRVNIYDINFNLNNEKVTIKGETNSTLAHQTLLDSLKNLGLNLIDQTRILPDSKVGDKKYAIANNSVINIRSKPKHSAELGTQALLGTPLKIQDKQGDFYRIQTPDGYISWVDKGGIYPMRKELLDVWSNSKKIIYTNTAGFVYEHKHLDQNIISDITLGGVLKYLSEDQKTYKVEYPDQRKGYIKKSEAILLKDWLKNNITTQKSIEKTAKSMLGFPYLWGGTSSKGMDCSGFTKMTYLLNGFVIPRDASQQINGGTIVDYDLNFKNLQKGDLLFFGTRAAANKKQKVVHVGIWLGNDKMEFIHASGNVHISSMDKQNPLYDDFNKKRYLGSRRYLGVKDKNIIELKERMKL